VISLAVSEGSQTTHTFKNQQLKLFFILFLTLFVPAELMRKCFMINSPFVFNAVWYVIKGILAARYSFFVTVNAYLMFLVFVPVFVY
jgi:hypothetical protein